MKNRAILMIIINECNLTSNVNLNSNFFLFTLYLLKSLVSLSVFHYYFSLNHHLNSFNNCSNEIFIFS